VLENLDPVRRPLSATADFHELPQVQSITITQDRGNVVTLLFDADGSLEERFVAEQFLS
jgi:NAD+ kinase